MERMDDWRKWSGMDKPDCDDIDAVNRIIEEIKNDGPHDFNLDDPFDDPTLVTNAFMDIEWQDEHGNSALMLAAAENRILHVKGILTMAIKTGKLWQVVNLRNHEGLDCIEMAIRAKSDSCARLISRVTSEYAKLRPRKSSKEMANEEDVTIDMRKSGERDEFQEARALYAEHIKSLYPQEKEVSNSEVPVAQTKLNREKISNNLKNMQKGHEYLRMVKRSRSAHSRLLSQRTFSTDSLTTHESESATPPLPLPPHDNGVFSVMGEKIRNIFTRKPPITHSSSLTSSNDRLPSATVRTNSSDKTNFYHEYHKSDEEDLSIVRLPQQTSTNDDIQAASSSGSSSIFRSTPFSHSKFAKPPTKGSNMVNTPNGVRLPPLSLRRRTSSDPRNREFTSLVEEN